MAVDVAAGSDALDDLLAEIAALVEVQGMELAGLLGDSFLRQIALRDVDAVDGDAFSDAEGVESVCADRGGSGGDELLPEPRGGVFRDPEGVMVRQRAVAAADSEAKAARFGLNLRERFG